MAMLMAHWRTFSIWNFELRGVVLPVLVSLSPVLGSAQGTITLAAGTAPSVQIAPRGKIAIPVIVDMAHAATGMNLAAITAVVTWDQTRLIFDSLNTGQFGQLSANTAQALMGVVTMSAFSVRGAAKTMNLATLYFTAAEGTGAVNVDVKPTVAGNEVGTPILPLLRSRSLVVCVQARAGKCVSATKR